MKQMKKSLSKRDSMLLVLLALLALGLLYYFLVYRPTEDKITALQAQQAQVESEIDILTTKMDLLVMMQNELPQLREGNKPVAPYDNSKPVMQALNSIMAPSQEFNITFTVQEDAQGGSIIRRLVQIEFLCASYASAKAIIRDLGEVPFRCQISSATLGSVGGGAQMVGDLSAAPIRGTVSITFFETV